MATTAQRLTPGEAGKILGVGPQRIRDLVDEGRLPAERTATGVRLIPVSAVEQLLEERQCGRGHTGR